MKFDRDVISLALANPDAGAVRFDEAMSMFDQCLQDMGLALQQGKVRKLADAIASYRSALTRLLIVNASLGVAHGIAKVSQYVDNDIHIDSFDVEYQ